MLKVMSRLHDDGYITFTPFGDYSPVDLIAMSKDGKCYRLQVKYRSKIKQVGVKVPPSCGKYELKARSMVNGISVPIDRNMIDGWAVYLSDDDKVFFIPSSKFTNPTFKLTGNETEFGSLT